MPLLDLTSRHGLDITFHNGVLRGLSDFSVGVGMAVLYRGWKPRDTLPAAVHSLIQASLLFALFYAFYQHRLVAHAPGYLGRAADAGAGLCPGF